MIIYAESIIRRFDQVPVADAAIVVKNGHILAVGKASAITKKYHNHRIVRPANAVIMPGLVNAHAHLELPLLLDDIRAQNYTDWVLNLLKEKKRLTKTDYTAAAQRNITALLQSGTTTVAEISTHGASPPLLAKSGLRSIIFHEIISMVQDNKALVLPHLRSATRLLRYGYSPHSTHTVSEAALREVCRVAARKAIPLCMHVAETKEELRLLQHRKSSLNRLYAAAGWDVNMAPNARSSFEFLRSIGILSPAFLAVHAVQADSADISIIKRSGAGIAHCPRSNHEIGVGTMDLAKILEARIPVGLGTDSLASSPSLNLWDEMRYACKVHRRSGVTQQDIFYMATMGGARVLGMDQEIGSLEPGKKADIIAIPLPRRDSGNLYSDLLRETKTCIMTMVNGRVLHQQRQVTPMQRDPQSARRSFS